MRLYRAHTRVREEGCKINGCVLCRRKWIDIKTGKLLGALILPWNIYEVSRVPSVEIWLELIYSTINNRNGRKTHSFSSTFYKKSRSARRFRDRQLPHSDSGKIYVVRVMQNTSRDFPFIGNSSKFFFSRIRKNSLGN